MSIDSIPHIDDPSSKEQLDESCTSGVAAAATEPCSTTESMEDGTEQEVAPSMGSMSTAVPESAEDLSTTINRLQDETKAFLSKWLEELRPCEEFELLYPSRINQLLEEARSFEEKLLQQKQKIKGKLTSLNEIMKTPQQTNLE